jgi:DnaA family protein
MKQIPLAILPEAEPSFDSFLPGANAAAVQHLKGLQDVAAPVYLWGPAGSGKTHLMRALAAQRQAAGERVGWFDARSAPPWSVDEGWSLVLLDDCQDFDAGQQQAAFAVFVDAVTFGVQVVAAGRVPPVDLPVREDLRTRLGWGHVFALQPLAEEQARAALRREADRRGIFLSDDVMDYLLTRFARDLKHLMQLLDRLDTFALSQQRNITVPLLKSMLAEEKGA